MSLFYGPAGNFLRLPWISRSLDLLEEALSIKVSLVPISRIAMRLLRQENQLRCGQIHAWYVPTFPPILAPVF